MWEIYYKHCLGGGSLITMLKCTILGLMAAAKVFKVNSCTSTQKRDAILFSKLQHPNVMQLKVYGVQESQPFMIFELTSK
jgi:hypothetical protein